MTPILKDSAKLDLLPMGVEWCCRIGMSKLNWASKNNYQWDAGNEKKQPASLQRVVRFAIEGFRCAFGQKRRVKEDRITPLSRNGFFNLKC